MIDGSVLSYFFAQITLNEISYQIQLEVRTVLFSSDFVQRPGVGDVRHVDGGSFVVAF
jgi:hypothetical protein